MQEKRTDELDELLEKMKPEQLGDYYKDNKKYMADDKKTFSYYMKDVLANKNLMCTNRKICLKDIYSIAGVSESGKAYEKPRFDSSILYSGTFFAG